MNKSKWIPSEVRELRRRLELTQPEFAKKLNPCCTISTVSRWETGRSKVGRWYRMKMDRIEAKLNRGK